MNWRLSWRADHRAIPLADRHYNRQSQGSPQFVPPGRCVVLLSDQALWVTSWPFAEFTHHAWAGAWINSTFRNEGTIRSSQLILEAVQATQAVFGPPPPLGLVTFVDPSKVRHKRDPGRCYLRAGFRNVGSTQGGLLALQLLPADMPTPHPPVGFQTSLQF